MLAVQAASPAAAEAAAAAPGGSSGHAAADSATPATAVPDEAAQVPEASLNTATALDEDLQSLVDSFLMATEPSEAADMSAFLGCMDSVPGADAAAAGSLTRQCLRGTFLASIKAEVHSYYSFGWCSHVWGHISLPTYQPRLHGVTTAQVQASAAPDHAVQAPATRPLYNTVPAAPAAASSVARPMGTATRHMACSKGAPQSTMAALLHALIVIRVRH